MSEDEKDEQVQEDAPERLSGDELIQEGANLDEGKLEGEGPPPK